MKTYTLTIKDSECVIKCSDGRENTYKTIGKDDARIFRAIMMCKMAGYDLSINYE